MVLVVKHGWLVNICNFYLYVHLHGKVLLHFYMKVLVVKHGWLVNTLSLLTFAASILLCNLPSSFKPWQKHFHPSECDPTNNLRWLSDLGSCSTRSFRRWGLSPWHRAWRSPWRSISQTTRSWWEEPNGGSTLANTFSLVIRSAKMVETSKKDF